MLLLLLVSLILTVVQGKGIIPEVELYRSGHEIPPQNQAVQQEKVKFQFYYESGCPYSVRIYLSELQDVVKELLPYLDFTTYPYGNARMKLNGTQLTIKCQHEEAECYGNVLHACAIDSLKDALKYVPYNACMMLYNLDVISDDEAADECGKTLNVDSEPIKECAKGIRGFELLLHYGIESGKVKYRGVPWWYVNGVSKKSGEEKSLKEIVCAAFQDPPEVCNKIDL